MHARFVACIRPSPYVPTETPQLERYVNIGGQGKIYELVGRLLLQSLLATLTSPAGGCGVGVSLPVPASAGRDSKVVIRGICVARQPVIITHGQSLSAHVDVVTGMPVPLRLEGTGDSCTPVISSEGTLYVPLYKTPDVRIFLPDGTPLPPLSLARLGLSTRTNHSAFDEVTKMLILADVNGSNAKLVAVDAVSRAVRWSTELFESCYGIAMLPAHGLVVASM